MEAAGLCERAWWTAQLTTYLCSPGERSSKATQCRDPRAPDPNQRNSQYCIPSPQQNIIPVKPTDTTTDHHPAGTPCMWSLRTECRGHAR